MNTFEHGHPWSLREHRFLHFEGEQPKAEQPSPEAKNERPAQGSSYADRAQERQQRVQEHLQQESLEKDLFERTQRAVDAVRTKVEQGQPVTAVDLRPLRDVMYEVRQKFDGTSAVVQVEKILGTVGQSVQMKGPDGTNYRLLVDRIDNPQDQTERGGFNFYFMLVKEDRNGLGTPIVRDGPGVSESMTAAQPLLDRTQRAVDAVRTKVEQGQPVTAVDLRPLRDVMYEVRQKFDGTSAVVQVEKILGTVGQSVQMKGPDGTNYRLLVDRIDNPQDQTERGGFNFYFMLVKEDRNGLGTPIVRDGPR